MGHADSTIEFVENCATMVYGENRDDDGQESNGAGKSAILEALTILILGDPLRDVPIKKMIRRGATESIIEGVLENPATKDVMKITRTLYANTKSQVLRIIDAANPKGIEVVSVLDGNKKILEKLGLSKDDLLNYYLISKEKYESFLSSGDTAKKSIVARFSNADMIDPVDGVVKAEVDEVEEYLVENQSKIIKYESIIEVYEQQIQDATSNDELEKRRAEKLVKLGEELIEAEDKVEITVTEGSSIEEELEGLARETPTSDTSKLESSIVRRQERILEVTELSEEEAKVNTELVKDIRHLEAQISGAIECPECHHKFLLRDKEFNIEEAKEDLKYKRDIEKIESDEIVEMLDTQITGLKDAVKEIRLKIDLELEKLRKHKLKVSGKKDEEIQVSKRYKIQVQNVKDFQSIIRRVKDYEIEDITVDLRKKQIEARESLEKAQEESIEINEAKFNTENWRGVFKQFKTRLTNKAIGAIQYQANQSLSEMRSNLRVRIDGHKVNTDKSISEKISVTVFKDGDDVGLFGGLSSGEKVRVEIGFILALQCLINNSAGTGGLDLTFLDEITNSLDSKGVENMMDMLNGLKRNFHVITHATFNKHYPHTIKIIKENGICTIE